MSLSEFWGKHHHRAMDGASETMRLAIALGAVRNIVRVVDRTQPPLTVDWARVSDDPDSPIRSLSFTDLRNGHIRLNPLPIMDGTLSAGRALDVVAGFGLHEASHSQESRPRASALVRRERVDKAGSVYREVPIFEPIRVAAYLWNLAEDERIERVTESRWPGFGPYFDAVLGWMWTEMKADKEMPEAYGPTLKDKLRVVFLACRYPTKAQAKYAGTAVEPEIAWWKAWHDDYMTDRIDTATTIRRGLDHLAEEQVTKDELDKMVLDERAERKAGEQMAHQIERLIREGVKDTFEVCVGDNAEQGGLSDAQAAAVDDLVRQRLRVVPGNGAGEAPLYVRRPTEDGSSKRAYVGQPDAKVEALRSALVFRPSAPQHDVKLLKQGALDEDELYRWGTGDDRVFSERVVEAKPDAYVGLLVDLSGSMVGHHLPIAQRLAQLLVWSLHDQEGVEARVWGHTADTDGAGPSSQVYELWQPGDPLSRLGLISTLPHSNNRDHQAIRYVVDQVAEAEQPEKIVIVLSDGLPQARGYGGREAMSQVRAVTKRAATRGIRVVQIAIDDDLRAHDQAAMFGDEVVPYRDEASLPRQLATLLGRYV